MGLVAQQIGDGQADVRLVGKQIGDGQADVGSSWATDKSWTDR